MASRGSSEQDSLAPSSSVRLLSVWVRDALGLKRNALVRPAEFECAFSSRLGGTPEILASGGPPRTLELDIQGSINRLRSEGRPSHRRYRVHVSAPLDVGSISSIAANLPLLRTSSGVLVANRCMHLDRRYGA